ncbi:MAG: hypothetical protein J6B12_00255, partial [Clostridia bacterium]|nr:hypothetical protein [Clostridia bacterium]
IARGFSMIAMLVGFLAYRHSIGKLFFSVTDRLGMMIGRGIRTVFLCVTRPMARALIWLFKTTVKPIQFFRHMIKERHIQKYNAMRVEQLRKISIEGFVNI